MDDSAHRENGRHKPPQGQWLMQHQPSMKQIMTIIAEKDAAIQERNLALSEKKAAIAERDLAILQRDSAITERNNAMMERDNAIAALHFRENGINNTSISSWPPACQSAQGIKLVHHPQQQIHHQAPYSTRDVHPVTDNVPLSPAAPEPANSRLVKRSKEAKTATKKTAKSLKKVKREGDDLNKTMMNKSEEWNRGLDIGNGSGSGCGNLNRHVAASKPDWKDQSLGLNQVAFDESTMPVPVCSCTGVLRSCYKWGNGGWQSSCCTTNLSMYPLPAMPNRRHARVGGRKMSGSAFAKLLSRLAAEGHDLSNPVDLKENWAKHGTNRYVTIK